MSEKLDINEDDYVELFHDSKVNKKRGQLINPKGKSRNNYTRSEKRNMTIIMII